MKLMKRSCLVIGLCCVSLFAAAIQPRRRPQLTVVMVIDQMAYHYIAKLQSHFKYGLRFLLSRGVVYENAYHWHAIPSTGPGHTTLSTGVPPKDHGIIANAWIDEEGQRVACDDDSAEKAAVFSPNGFYDYGKSPHFIMVDGITDQFMLSETPCNSRDSFSISFKSRSAICTANKLGKAIWFDQKKGTFTSSKAYFDILPAWLIRFNKEKRLDRLKKVSWPLAYPCKKRPYCFKNINNYEWGTYSQGIAGKQVSINQADEKPYTLFEHTPAANQLLFDCALRCVEEHLNRTEENEMLLWLCLSPLDFVGHDFGPQSLEAIDMIYHLDKQIETFMHQINCYAKRTHTLFVLTADHGVSPIPELMNKQGYGQAQRVRYNEIAKEINKSLAQKLGIKDLAIGCQSAQFIIHEKKFQKLSPEMQDQVTQLLKEELLQQAGIKRVWTYEELSKNYFEPTHIESYFKNTLYPGRTSRFIIQTTPYCSPQDCPDGTGHRTPYEYDTHVPLILYQKGNIEKRIIHEKVWTTQLANSLAYLLNIPKPSASTYQMLPGLVDYDPITGEVIATAVI